jgi:hypothetical protein
MEHGLAMEGFHNHFFLHFCNSSLLKVGGLIRKIWPVFVFFFFSLIRGSMIPQVGWGFGILWCSGLAFL